MEQLEYTSKRRVEMQVDTHNYTGDYNPQYPDQQLLAEAEHEIASMEGVASLEDIEAELQLRGRIARGESNEIIVTTGNCEREITLGDDPDADTERVVNEILAQETIVHEELDDAHHESRDINQHFKPRSQEFEKDENGKKVPSHYGSGINGKELSDRTPDPSRAVAGALFSRDVCEHYKERTGKRIKSSHEAMLLMFERNSVRIQDGTTYLASAVTPWLGNRTRGHYSRQLEILKDIINPVAVKIDDSITANDIAMLYQTLNPNRVDGKVTYILRLGVKNKHKADELVAAIQNLAPNSLIACDPLHGNTKTAKNKVKTRELPDAEEEMLAVAQACKRNRTRLHQLHIEANGRDDVEECVDEKGMQPRDKSRVDPCVNNRQLRSLLRFYRTQCQ